MSNRKIAIDVDEVLADFVGGFVPWFCDGRGLATPPKEALADYNLARSLKVPKSDMVQALIEFTQGGHLRRVVPLLGAKEAVARLWSQFDLYVVTARHKSTTQDTIDWLDEHFPGRFRDIHFTGHQGLKRPKSEICRAANLGTLVEDNGDYAQECAERGINVVLMNHPWNKTVANAGRIIRAQDWFDAAAAVEELNPRWPNFLRRGERTLRYLSHPALTH